MPSTVNLSSSDFCPRIHFCTEHFLGYINISYLDYEIDNILKYIALVFKLILDITYFLNVQKRTPPKISVRGSLKGMITFTLTFDRLNAFPQLFFIMRRLLIGN